MKTISILGAGAWGTAIATVLAQNGHMVKLWCLKKERADEINQHHVNKRYLPGISLAKNITATSLIDEAICDVDWIFEAIPTIYLRSVLEKGKDCFEPNQRWVILSKGIEQETLLFPTQMLDEVFKADVQKMVLAGPSFAADVARKQITAVTIAAADCDQAKELQVLLANEYFRPYVTTDIIGVQVGAALKNVIALGVGMLQGAGYGDNPQAFLLTRGLHEMTQFAQALGGKQETLYGLSGVGDVVLTAMGTLSRNREVGMRIGKGETLEYILEQTGYIPEGINTVQATYQLIQKKKLSLPICEGIYQVIFSGKLLRSFLKELMDQPLSMECAK